MLTARRIARNAAPLACALVLGGLVVLDAAERRPSRPRRRSSCSSRRSSSARGGG
ncbi:hypothetical protein [Sorangium sp. So ce1335]|uniref:hypothetical protein n=1 Tax=Sorangium sp. So ce1335 TaxID=3133335 RepID=UPI003F603F71